MSAASSLYTSRERVIRRLPAGYDPVLVDVAEIDQARDDASRWIDAGLRDKFIPFNGVADTPATPKPITALATRKAVLLILEVVRKQARNTQLQDEIDWADKWVEKELRKILAGDVVLPEEVVTTQTLAWGDGSAYSWDTSWAKLGATGTAVSGDPISIIPTSVKVLTPSSLVGYRYGSDHVVRYDGSRRAWFLVDLAGALNDQTSTVTFRWTYDRVTDSTSSGARLSGRYELV